MLRSESASHGRGRQEGFALYKVARCYAGDLQMNECRRERARTFRHVGIETAQAKVNGLLPLEVLLPLE